MLILLRDRFLSMWLLLLKITGAFWVFIDWFILVFVEIVQDRAADNLVLTYLNLSPPLHLSPSLYLIW